MKRHLSSPPRDTRRTFPSALLSRTSTCRWNQRNEALCDGRATPRRDLSWRSLVHIGSSKSYAFRPLRQWIGVQGTNPFGILDIPNDDFPIKIRGNHAAAIGTENGAQRQV